MPRVRRRKRLCKKNLPLADTTVKAERLSREVDVETHCSVPKVETTSSYEELDQEAVNDQIIMEQNLCATEAVVATTILSEASDAGIAATDLAANATHSTESSNGSRTPIGTPKIFNASTQPTGQTKRELLSCNSTLSRSGKVISTEETINPSRRTKQTAKRSTGARHPPYPYMLPGQKAIRKVLHRTLEAPTQR
jgi:hypothetical protein